MRASVLPGTTTVLEGYPPPTHERARERAPAHARARPRANPVHVPPVPSAKRFIGRLAALATAPLAHELLVPELLVALRQAIGTDDFLPYVLATDPQREASDEFRVWRGSENNTDELRLLLRAGLWPAPPSIPNLQQLMRERLPRCVFTAPLWGDDPADDGPWSPLWRARGVRHGYYLVAFADDGEPAPGRAIVALLSRGPSSPPFTAADIAVGEATSRIVARTIAQPSPAAGTNDTLVAESALTFDASCSIASLGIGGAELLRDADGGGPGAGRRARARVEEAARRYAARLASNLPDEGSSAAALPDAGFRRGHLQLMRNRNARAAQVETLGTNAKGAFTARLAPTVDTATGEVRILGTLQQRAPRMLALVRGLVAIDAPGRELQLALRLGTGDALGDAAQALGLAQSSAKTLLSRLAARMDHDSGREQLIDRIVELGTTLAR